MTTEYSNATVGGVRVAVIRKRIKNLHLGVYPPDGRVRIAVPSGLPETAVRAAISGNLPWIRKRQASFKRQARESAREMVSGESHWYQGRRYRLRVVEAPGRPRLALAAGSTMELQCPAGTGTDARAALLERWYRDRLGELVPELLEKWAPIVGVQSPAWRLRRMRTKWGSYSHASRRIWLNLELAKKPSRCLEYILVHELVHILERRHNRRFTAVLDQTLPHWRPRREELGDLPLAHYPWPD